MTTKIYGFFNSTQEVGEAVGIAISEQGDVVASHISSSESWSKHDLGMDGYCKWKHDKYNKAFPDGWECEFVYLRDIYTHEGLQLALKKNKEKQRKGTR